MIQDIRVGDLVEISRSAASEVVGDILVDEEEYYQADFGIVTHVFKETSPHGEWLLETAAIIGESINHEDYAEVTIWSSIFGRLETYLCGETVLSTGMRFGFDRIKRLT